MSYPIKHFTLEPGTSGFMVRIVRDASTTDRPYNTEQETHYSSDLADAFCDIADALGVER